MTTPTIVDGYESGVLSTNGGGLCSTITGAPTVQATTKRTGAYALKVDDGGESIEYTTATPTVLVGSIYIYYKTALPDADEMVCFARVTSGAVLSIKYNAATKKLYARFWSVSSGTDCSVVIAVNTWYRIDFKFSVAANPSTIDFQVNGTAATQHTAAQAATTFTSLGIGATEGATLESYYDDLIVSQTSGDYPIGAHVVEAFLPDSDGTHNNAANIMEDNDGNDIGTVTAFDHINQLPMSEATVYIRQTDNGTANYAEVLFADVGSYTAYFGVSCTLAYASASTSANEGGCIVVNGDAVATTIWGSASSRADYSETAMQYKRAIIAAPGAGWSQAAINALVARMGYSNDANPDPYWHNLLLQVCHNATAPAAAFVYQRKENTLLRM